MTTPPLPREKSSRGLTKASRHFPPKVRKSGRSPSEGGWTLVELSLVVGILAILTALGLSALQDTTRRITTAAAMDELFASMRVLRREARERSVPVVFQMNHESAESDARLVYQAFIQPAHVPGGTVEEPDVDDNDSWLIRPVRLPRELDLSPAPANSELPPPFNSLVGSNPCSFCEEEPGLRIVFLSDDAVALGDKPEEHQSGGGFTLGRWNTVEHRLSESAAPEHHHFLLLGRTGSIHRFVR